MEEAQHPDYEYEAAKLQRVLNIIKEETGIISHQEKEQSQEVDTLRKHSGGAFLMELYVKETIYRHTVQTLRNLRLAEGKPYFTRIDFQEERKRDKEKYYIGKYGIMKSDTQEPIIIDWRSPIANLYYSGQTGPTSYMTPDGEVKGDLYLKRQFGIKEGKIETIFDTEVVSRDVYLQSILGSHAGDRLKDIVTTIQKEQNDIIRAPKDKPLVVQGVAGSGKTTIALHRIAYLLYTYQDTMAPENMMIIAPNPLFLDYISDVLPELGVENVYQTTFESLTQELLGQKLPKLENQDKLAVLLDSRTDEKIKEKMVQASKYKGTLSFKQLLDQYLLWLENHIVPPIDVKLGPILIYTYEEMQRFYVEDLKPFPLSRRKKETQKHLLKKANDAVDKITKLLERECQKRIQILKMKMEDTEERREMIIRIYQNRDQRIQEAKNSKKAFIENYMGKWLPLGLMDVYKAFFQEIPPFSITDVDHELWKDLCLHSLPILEKGKIESEDFAPLLYLQSSVNGLSRKLEIYHSILDEAQDFSPFEYYLLKSLTGNSSFTIVGDLSQGIHAYRGVQNWKVTMDDIFQHDDPQYLTLAQSYRNTIEIMDFANKVAAKASYPGQVLANPVLRHGEEPSVIAKASQQEVTASIGTKIDELLQEGYKTIAIIHKTTADCKDIYGKLKKITGHPLQLLTSKDTRYQGGIMVIPSYMAKGLEFDVVIMADVSEKSYSFNQLDARLLYVCFTRPLHRLYCYYTGKPSPLL